jgi:hypothetical protein
VLEAKHGMSAMDWKEATKHLWRPDFRPRLAEWVADFALAGQAALEGPEWASRMVLFRLYYLGMAPYESRSALSRAERAKLGELVGGSATPLRERAAAPRHVSTAQVLHIDCLAWVSIRAEKRPHSPSM